MAFTDLIAERTNLGHDETEHLARLVGEWQLLADLAFADLLLLCPERGSNNLVVVAQMRPYTAQTVYQDDHVGSVRGSDEAPFTRRALQERRIVREGEPLWRDGIPIRVEAIPVRFGDRVIAGISQQANLGTARTPSRLELTYLQTAGELARMIAEGSFPFGDEPDPETLPRVGDGLVRLDPVGRIAFASPNAVSAYRRVGVTENVLGRGIDEVDLHAGPIVETLRSARPSESEIDAGGAVILRRALPLLSGGALIGGLVLVRDITELRRRDRMLQMKDATIREVHHRVKNNLQTVASLLRLQARRNDRADVREALAESERRIRSIALVHETLSLERGDTVDFDQVARQIAHMVSEGLTGPEVEITVDGAGGPVIADVATPMAVVLSELLQNSVEHAFDERGGRIRVELDRGDRELRLEVRDDGRGIPGGFTLEDGTGLGLQIARTLVESELGGQIELAGEGGTRATVRVPLGDRPVR